MLNFIILGYVPGTTFQITFNNFILTVTIIVIAYSAVWYHNYAQIRRRARKIIAIQLITL